MTRRLKRGASPRTWAIPRKGTKWVQRVAAGAHPQTEAIPMVQLLREVRGVARTAREARAILREGLVSVDGKIVREVARGVGLMDTVSFAKPVDEHFRLLKDQSGRFRLVKITAAEAAFKIGQVRRKTTVSEGKTQVTLHDGRNLIAPAKATWRVGDSLKIGLPDQKVLLHLPLKPGLLAYLAGGSHVGEIAKIDRIEVVNSPQPNLVHFTEGFSSIKEYVFVIGENTPQVQLPGGGI
ncbi:MAG: 30S ribosomal protein S4e [Thermoplasmata archaeon]|nr:30S ribosomal protein S4e [Thermoplasmata archaeon]